MTETLPHWLTKQASLSPNKTAITLSDSTAYTFLELQTASMAYAEKLSGLGIKESSKVAILSGNCKEMIVTIHALSYLKAVAVLLNTRLTENELHHQLEVSHTELVIASKEMKQKKQINHFSIMTYHELENCQPAQVSLAREIDLNTPYTMMFTSGTTGKPKMVVHTYGNHWWSAIGSALNLGIHETDTWLLTLPLFHVGGFSILIKNVIYGMGVVMLEKYDQHSLIRWLQSGRITIASIVTLMLRNLLTGLGEQELSRNVRCLLLGGCPVPSPLLDQVRAKALPLFQSYGMTETSSQIVTLGAEHIFTKIGSSGKPLFPAQIKIVDKDHEGIGEIMVKGQMVIDGYYHNPEANKKSITTDGWLKTGDLGHIDEDGFLYVVERRSDLIISGGENIYPQEIENVLVQKEGVIEAAVAKRTDEKWGQIPIAYVVCEQGSVTKEQLYQLMERDLAAYKIPKEIHFLHELPRNASNKIMRHVLERGME